jgi:hypothetical protein
MKNQKCISHIQDAFGVLFVKLYDYKLMLPFFGHFIGPLYNKKHSKRLGCRGNDASLLYCF